MPSGVCNVLSSFALRASLLILSVNTVCNSLLNLRSVHSYVLLFSKFFCSRQISFLVLITHVFVFLLRYPPSLRQLYILGLRVTMVYSIHVHISYILEASSKRPNDFSFIGRKPNEIF